MKKFIFMMIAMFTMAISANAQNQTNYAGSSNFTDNWSIGTDGGITTNLHDWDTPNGGVWGVQLTKGITPIFSLELSGQMGFNNNANWNIAHSANGVDNVNVMAGAKVNLMNAFCGYKGAPRFFEIQARGGIGYQWGFYPDDNNNVNSGVAKLGFDFDFNLGKEKAWTVSVRPAVVLRTQNGLAGCDYADACTRYSHNATGQLTAGVVYHFKTSNGKHYMTNPRLYDENDVKRRLKEMGDKMRERRPQPRPTEKIVEKIVQAPQSTYVVSFAQNSAELTSEAKATLDKVAQNSIVNVAGSTSPEGTTKRNTELAQQRADAVKAYLESRGVKVESAKGAEAGRVAVVTLK